MENERYAYVPVGEQPLTRWPGDARVALWVIPNIEHFRFDDREFGGDGRGTVPDVPRFSERDYGNRVGVWRIMDVLDTYGVRATVALNSDVCLYEPDIIAAGNERHWEWMGHGHTNSSRLTGLDAGEERQVIADVLQTIERTTGTRPKGWLGPGRQENVRTPDILAEAGLSYVVDWNADDVLIPLKVRTGRLVAMPYSGLSDKSAFAGAGWEAKSFYEMIRDQFDVVYEQGATRPQVLSIALHPYLTGRAFRTKWLDEALAYITGHDRVWVTTGSEIVDCYLQQQDSGT